MPKKRQDITGQRFGRLLVVRTAEPTSPTCRAPWLCHCDCGGEVVVSSSNLFNGNTKSCGCLHKEQSSLNGKALALPVCAVGNKRLLYVYRRGAKIRGLVWGLPSERFKTLIQSPCFYCGDTPANVFKLSTGEFIYNGVDRVDNGIGYTPENSVPCCGVCNWMKKQLSVDQFITHIKKITAYQSKQTAESVVGAKNS